MSLPYSEQATVATMTVRGEETRGPARLARGLMEPWSPPTSIGIACRDVIDEVQARMARLGYRWS